MSYFKAAYVLICKINYALTMIYLANAKENRNMNTWEFISTADGSFFIGDSGETAPGAYSYKGGPGAALLQERFGPRWNPVINNYSHNLCLYLCLTRPEDSGLCTERLHNLQHIQDSPRIFNGLPSWF